MKFCTGQTGRCARLISLFVFILNRFCVSVTNDDQYGISRNPKSSPQVADYHSNQCGLTNKFGILRHFLVFFSRLQDYYFSCFKIGTPPSLYPHKHPRIVVTKTKYLGSHDTYLVENTSLKFTACRTAKC